MVGPNHVVEKLLVKFFMPLMTDPFAEFRTTYRQQSYVQKNMNFVAPCQYVLGKKIGFQNKGPKRLVCEQEDTMVYIPILNSLNQLLSNAKISDTVTCQKFKYTFQNNVFSSIFCN